MEADVFVKVIQESVPKNLIRSSESPIHLKRAYTFTTWQDVSLGTVIGRLPKAQIYSTIDTVSELGVFPDGSVFVGKTITSDFVTLPVTLVNRFGKFCIKYHQKFLIKYFLEILPKLPL